jgi:hypothetical protein
MIEIFRLDRGRNRLEGRICCIGATKAGNNILLRTDFLFTTNINCDVGDINLVFSRIQIMLSQAICTRQSEVVGSYLKKY